MLISKKATTFVSYLKTSLQDLLRSSNLTFHEVLAGSLWQAYEEIDIFVKNFTTCHCKKLVIPLNVGLIGRHYVRGGGGGSPAAWKIQGKLCFQGKRKLLKNPER